MRQQACELVLHGVGDCRFELFDGAGTNGGFLLKHSTGSAPEDSEVDVPLNYADYYFLEALLRYRAAAGGSERAEFATRN